MFKFNTMDERAYESKKRKDGDRHCTSRTHSLLNNEDIIETSEVKKRKLIVDNRRELHSVSLQNVNKYIRCNNGAANYEEPVYPNGSGNLNTSVSRDIGNFNLQKENCFDKRLRQYSVGLDTFENRNLCENERDEIYKEKEVDAVQLAISPTTNLQIEKTCKFIKNSIVDTVCVNSFPGNNNKSNKSFTYKQKKIHNDPGVDNFTHTSLVKNDYGLSSSEYYVYNIQSTKQTTYEDAIILNELWNTYVNELTESTHSHNLSASTIYEMELNGAYLEIHKSYCATYIGIKGIVLLETVNSFKMITPENKIVTILKNKTVFTISIKEKKYFLNGVHLIRDPALKSAKKFKSVRNKWV